MARYKRKGDNWFDTFQLNISYKPTNKLRTELDMN